MKSKIDHHSFTHRLDKHLWGSFCVPGTLLGTGNIAMNNEDKNSCPLGARILVEGRQAINKHIHAYLHT